MLLMMNQKQLRLAWVDHLQRLLVGSGAEMSGSTVTITKAGTYVLSGSSKNVQVVVKVGDQDKVQLVLNGVTMTGTDAAIVVENADKTFITLAKGSKNTISDSANHKNTDYDAAIYSGRSHFQRFW